MSANANSRITVVDIQHRTFKRALQGYDRTDVDKFLDEIIESLEDEATARADTLRSKAAVLDLLALSGLFPRFLWRQLLRLD